MKRQKPIDILTRDEVLRLLDSTSRGVGGIRDRALISLLYRSGLRVSEALDLRVYDIEGRTVRVQCGKGGKPRTSGIEESGPFVEHIRAWIHWREEAGVPDDVPLFCSYSGGRYRRISPQNVWDRMQTLKRKAGIAKRVHPHGFRHTMACELVRERFSAKLIQQQLGHSDLSRTQLYLDGLNPEALIEAMGARS